MRSQLFATLPIVFLSGCEPPQAQPGNPPAAPAPSATPAMGATTVWSQAQVEEFVKAELALTTIAVQSTGGYDYQGTGTDANGITYTLTVKQVPGGIKVEWRHQSDFGKITFGNPVP